MQTEYEFIYFVEKANAGRKTKIWACRNRKSEAFLGFVLWHAGWRQYVFQPNQVKAPVIFSAGCLTDIGNFIAQLMHARRDVQTSEVPA